MTPSHEDIAKQAFIAYKQLEAFLKDQITFSNVTARVPNYNHILSRLKECFSIDKTFLQSIEHLAPLRVGDVDPNQMKSDGDVLLATAYSFVEFYLSPEDKKRTMVFHS